MFRLVAPPSHDLIDTLFRDVESLSDAPTSFTRFVASDDLGLAPDFFGHQIVLRFGWVLGVVERLHDVKRRQPNIEASCMLF